MYYKENQEVKIFIWLVWGVIIFICFLGFFGIYFQKEIPPNEYYEIEY